jgi:hypothetical protein
MRLFLAIWSLLMVTNSFCAELSLTGPVSIKGEPWSYQHYVTLLTGEIDGAIDFLYQPDMEWSVPESLRAKVNQQGELTPFFGDTTVFSLSDGEIKKVGALIDTLQPTSLFATPLDRQQLHMTLHDLNNSPRKEEVSTAMESTQLQTEKIMQQLNLYLERHPEDRYINMVSTKAFDCLNIAVLLGFKPASERDYKILMNLYNLFEPVVYLDYWLRPHVTLTYFKPRVPTEDEVALLRDSIERVNQHSVELKLDIMELAYQHFYDMNSYQTVARPL